MTHEMLELFVETRHAPTLSKGDVFGPLTRTNGVRGLTPGQPLIAPKPQDRAGHA